MKPRQLSDRDCHVWLAVQPPVLAPEQAEVWQSWLTRAELQRFHSFRFRRHREQYLLTRALVRTTLSAYTDVSPEAWRFVENAHGKPRVRAPSAPEPLAFNLSNTDGLIACAVTSGADVGVDVENGERPGETVSIAASFFSGREADELRALPKARQRERFFQYWTLKESYIKARGLGLAIPLEQFSFVLSDSGAIDVVFDPRLRDEPSAWQFRSMRVSTSHALALAVRRASSLELRVEVRETFPTC